MPLRFVGERDFDGGSFGMTSSLPLAEKGCIQRR